MKATTKKFYHWAIQKASSQKAPLWLALLFFLELAIFIPLDLILIFFCLQQRKNILLYILLAAVASTASGLVGYFLGDGLWDLISPYLIPHFFSQTAFDKIALHLDKYEHWGIFLGALFPFPLKVLSLASGVFDLGAGTFALYMGLARLVRFSLVGVAMAFFGERVKTFVDRHFHRLFLLLGAKVAAVSGFVWFITH